MKEPKNTQTKRQTRQKHITQGVQPDRQKGKRAEMKRKPDTFILNRGKDHYDELELDRES